MVGKFILCFLVAFCAMQAFEARSVEVEYNVIDDVLGNIKEIWDKLVEKVKEIIKKLEDIIGQINIKEIIEALKNRLKEIIEQAGLTIEAAKKCLEEAEGPERKLAEQLAKDIVACRNTLAPAEEDIGKIMQEMEGKMKTLTEEMKTKIEICNGQIGCILQTIIAETPSIYNLIKETLAEIVDIADKAGIEASNCVAAAVASANAKENEIVKTFYVCIKNISN